MKIYSENILVLKVNYCVNTISCSENDLIVAV